MVELTLLYIICISFVLYLARGLAWKELISFLDIRGFDDIAAKRLGMKVYKRRKLIA